MTDTPDLSPDALTVLKRDVTFAANVPSVLTITHGGRFALGPDASIDDAASALVATANTLHGTELAAAITRADEADARADAAEALTTEVTRLLAAEVIRLRQENDRLSQRVTTLWEANNAARAARAALEDTP